jgi:serine/threonine protein phosphatase PrpC
MSHDQPTPLWRGFGASVLGENHRRSGKPNQDAIGWYPPNGVGAPVVLTIADGHGGAAYPRSAEGAALAVQVTNKILYDLLDDPPRLQAVRDDSAARIVLAELIVSAWREAVDTLTGGAGAPDANRFIPFGTTLLSAAIGADCILYLQLGDGDLVILDSNGETSRPFPPDPRLTGNATTSLCLPDATLYLQILLRPRHPAPAMIAMATDGYANSFQDESGFLDAWRDIAVHLGQQGPDRLAHSLQGWLAETTKLGSGDDITVGLLACLDGRITALPATPKAAPTPQPVQPKPVGSEIAPPAISDPEPAAIRVTRPAPAAPRPRRLRDLAIGLVILAAAAAGFLAVRALTPPPHHPVNQSGHGDGTQTPQTAPSTQPTIPAGAVPPEAPPPKQPASTAPPGPGNGPPPQTPGNAPSPPAPHTPTEAPSGKPAPPSGNSTKSPSPTEGSDNE